MGRLGPTSDAVYRIKRGLAGYVSYLAACEMNEAFSEYVLYEPILRILSARGLQVACEVACPGYPVNATGDRKRLDFVATSNAGVHFALEVKWARSRTPKVSADIDKLRRYLAKNDDAAAFLCVFGTKKVLTDLSLPADTLRERGDVVYAEFGITRYGCRVYELSNARR